MHLSTLYTTLATLATAQAVVYSGFNYDSTKLEGTPKTQADFERQFNAARLLTGTNGAFNSARLYSMIQWHTTDVLNSAIPAAIATNTSLLLGIWTSDGQDRFEHELEALHNVIAMQGPAFTNLVVGISVGSEDLYRITTQGAMAGEGPGAEPKQLVNYIKQVRAAIARTGLARTPIGHVDTWESWTNTSNNAVIEAIDWVGADAYPYYQSVQDNTIGHAMNEFQGSISAVKAAVGEKPVWVTETGWPTEGPTIGKGVASVKNAQQFWQTVGCSLFGVTNTWWYTLADDGADTSFGVVSDQLGTTPKYNLACTVAK